MKSHFFKKSVALSLLGLLVMGCGKSESKGGSSSGSPSTSPSTWTPSTSNNTTATSSQALQNYNSWYTSTSESATPTVGLRSVVRTTLTYSASNGCTSQPLTIFGVQLGSTNFCLGGGSAPAKTVSTSFLQIAATNNKALNVKLPNILTSSYGELVDISQQGNIFKFTYFVNGTGAYDTVVVDTGINSALNPVYLSNTATKKVEQLTSF